MKSEQKKKKLPEQKLDKIVQKKLFVFITIVSVGHSRDITRLLEKHQVSAQFIQSGEGTASKEIYNLLGVEEVDKEIVFSFVTEEKIPAVKKDLSEYFTSNKRNRGIAMAIKLSSIIGVRVYQFLADLVEEK